MTTSQSSKGEIHSTIPRLATGLRVIADNALYARTTLTNSAFVRMLYDNDVLVWGSDVRSQDGWSGAI